ncbi:hypothetical protein [Roseibium salinum]|uniref:PAS domain-containing protein n=1 Tax=Roseibium salinum TaxID=1604349 RepID=A0ABT3QXL9_9HYPH|nr:hypothetical protein [Roseibium sp. DSM 29163]MCX2721695.1 hypothetical protein [Roseibium sp. DSM 29163]
MAAHPLEPVKPSEAPQTEARETEAPQKKEGEAPALSLAGLQFFIADISRKTILWHEIGSQSFNSEVKDLQEAPSNEALRHLSPEDRKTILHLVQGAIREGRAGPFDVGGGVDHRIPGIPIVAHRYELPDGRIIAICFPSIGEDDDNPGRVILGLAPILQHFVASSNRVVLLVDNFGYVRFASEGFVKSFQIEDARLIIGRNIAHIQKRVGRTIVSLALAALTRRASATGRGKFLLASNDSLELSYDAMYFRIGGTVGGVLFSAGHAGGDVDFAKVFEICSAPILIVNAKSRVIVAANNAAMKSFHLTAEILDNKSISETLLHPNSFTSLMEAAEQGSDLPVSVPVNLLNGQTKKKRFKCSLLDTDKKEPKLILETRT